ncbi:MAG: ABC transporter substrate-binding protein [Ilumatobacteraceae bacterium]
MNPRSHPRRRAVVSGAVVLGVALAACGSDDDAAEAPTAEAARPADTAFPLTIDNCGFEHTYEAAPERAVTMNQHSTELLLALGLADRMAGTAYMDSTILPSLADDYQQVPVLADRYPSREQVVAAGPDLVAGGFASAFDPEAAGSRESLADLSIGSYLTTVYCPDRDEAASVDDLYTDVANIAAIFGIPDRGDELIDEIDGQFSRVAETVAGRDAVTVFVYDSGTDAAFTAAGREMTTALISLAGGRNVFDDVDATFTEVSWEDVVERDPDAILILNYGDETVDDKRGFLISHPVASTLRAVQADEVFAVDLTDVVPSVRNGEVVEAIARELHPEAF